MLVLVRLSKMLFRCFLTYFLELFEPEKLALHAIETDFDRFFLIFDRLNAQSIDGNFMVGVIEGNLHSCCPCKFVPI